MLVKPIIDKIKDAGHFSDVVFSKSIPELSELKKIKSLPVCYLLPIKDTGRAISSDFKAKQEIEFSYSFCIIDKAGPIDGSEESPMTLTKQRLLDALLGFTVTEHYSNMAFIQGQLNDINRSHEIWIMGFSTNKTFKKHIT